MTSKTITIKEEIYNKLRQIKKDNESFSDLLDRLTQNVSPMEMLNSMAGTVDFGDADALKKDILKGRENWR